MTQATKLAAALLRSLEAWYEDHENLSKGEYLGIVDACIEEVEARP